MNFRRGDNSVISQYFQQAQHCVDPNQEQHLVEELKHVYDTVSFKDFVEKFIECLKYCLVHPEESPCIDAVLNFSAHFVAAINCSGADEDETCPFLKKILEFVCANHGCDNHLVRSRLCLFVDKLLCKLGNEVIIDELLYNKLVDSMLERMKDKMPGIRVKAISAVYRLQDPFDANCPVVKALSFHLSMDPSVEARRTILRKLAVAAHTLPTIVERIYDVKDFVRKDAFLVLSKCSMSRFTIKQRQMLLHSGLKDRDERVSKCVEKVLLPLWFDHAKNDFVSMLKFLDVETSTETSYLALQILFKSSSTQTIMEQIKSQLDEEKLIPLKKLSPENAFFWRCAVHYFHGLDDEASDEDKDFLEQSVLPELTPLTNYIREYFLKNQEEKQRLEFWEQKQRQFILLQLLQLCNVHDLSDELGRSQLKQLCTDLLLSSNVKKDAVSVIVNVFSRILPNIDEFLDTLVEIIMDLKEPFKDDENTDLSEEEADEEKKENEIVKISADVLSKCLTIIVEFLQNKNVMTFNPCLRSLVTTFVCPALEAQDTASRVLALHALSNSCLLDVDLARQYFLLFCFQVANDDMCLVALKGIFDLLLFYSLSTFNLSDQIDDTDEKKKDDEPEKKKRKLKGAMVEENSFVSNSGDANNSTNEAMNDVADKSANLITMLMSLLDSSSSDIRNVTVEGLCKLIIGGRITSVSLLSKLIILWFSPISEEDYVLRQQLGTFFNVYASSYAGSQYMFQQAFLPTLKTLYDAPIDSPLHEIDPDDVAKLLISLMFVRMSKEKGPNPHNSLAVAICKEILSTYSANLGNVPVLVRSLLPLQFSYDEPEFLEDLKDNCQQVLQLLEEANNKALAKYVQKILFKIEAAEMEINLQPLDINNTEQPAETVNSNMDTANNSLDASEGTELANGATAKGSEGKDDEMRDSKRKGASSKTLANPPLRVSDKENTNLNDVDYTESDVFDHNLDSDSDVDDLDTKPSKKSAMKNISSASASPAAEEEEENSLSRVNLKRKKAIKQLEFEKAVSVKLGAKQTDSKEKLGKEKAVNIQTRKSTRKKGEDATPTPSKRGRLQSVKSKKSVKGKENEKVGSDSDEESDKDVDNVPLTSGKKNNKKSKSNEGLKRSVDKEEENQKDGVTRRTRRGQKPSLEETSSKKLKFTPVKSKSHERSIGRLSGVDEDSSQSSDEKDSIEKNKKVSGRKVDRKSTNQEGSVFLRHKTDEKFSPSKPNKATPKKLIEVDNITEPNKRKSNVAINEGSPRVKRQLEKSPKELLSITPERSTRNSRAVSSTSSTPMKKTNKQPPKSVSKTSPTKTSSGSNFEDLVEVIKSSESLKQLESKRRMKDLEILEEISRRSLRNKADVEETVNKSIKDRKESPLKEKSPGDKDDSPDVRDSKGGSPSANSSPTKQSKRIYKNVEGEADSPSKKTVSKTPAGPNDEINSESRNFSKSPRIMADPHTSTSRKSIRNCRQSSGEQSEPAKKSVETRSRSSVDTSSPIRRNSRRSKSEPGTTHSLLRQVLTPVKARPSSKNLESPQQDITPTRKSKPGTSQSVTRSTSVKEKNQSVSSSKESRNSRSSRNSNGTSVKRIESSSPTPKKAATRRNSSKSSNRSDSINRFSVDEKTMSPARKITRKIETSGKESPSYSKSASFDKKSESKRSRTPEKKTLTRSKNLNVVKSDNSRQSRPTRKELSSSPKDSPSIKKDDRRISRSPEKAVSQKINFLTKSDLIESQSADKKSSAPRKSQLAQEIINSRQTRMSQNDDTPSPIKNAHDRQSRSVIKKFLSTRKGFSSGKKLDSRQTEFEKKLVTPNRTPSPSKRVDVKKSASPIVEKETRSQGKHLSPSRTNIRRNHSVSERSVSLNKSLSPTKSNNSRQSQSVSNKPVSPKRSISPMKKTSGRPSRSVDKKSVSLRSTSLSKKTNVRQSKSVEKKSVSPKRSTSLSKENTVRQSRSVEKNSISSQKSITPKRRVSPLQKTDVRHSKSVEKKTVTPKRSVLPSKQSNMKPSKLVEKKSISTSRNVSPSNAIKARHSKSQESVSPKKNLSPVSKTKSTPKKISPPVKNVNTKGSQFLGKRMAEKRSLPVGKFDQKQNQVQKKVSVPSRNVSVVKRVVSRSSLSTGIKTSHLSKSRLVVKKVNSRQSLVLKKRIVIKSKIPMAKINPKKTVPAKTVPKTSNRSLSQSSKKAEVARGRSPEKKSALSNRSQSMTASKGQFAEKVVGKLRSSVISPRARKTPAKLTL